MTNNRKKTTVATKTAVLSFHAQTLSTIKEGAANFNLFKRSLSQAAENTFLYGYKGETTGDSFTISERRRLQRMFESVDGALDLCKEWKAKEADNNKMEMVNSVSGIDSVKNEDERFDNWSLLYEAFKITFFWKFEVMPEHVDNTEIIPALQLWAWLTGLIVDVMEDYEEYNKAAASKV